ncbi:MAG TPA: Ku protein [Pseudonocardiaceae bacterium]|jgi:DNA end-binding protein Ku
MRSVWKGSVAFGMVTIPVRLYTATQEHDVRFHQVHSADGGRIRYKRVCEIDGEEVPYADIDRAVEQPDGSMVMVTKEELDELAVPTGHEIDVIQFVPAEQIDPVLYAKSYYVEPDPKAVKPYELLREALRDTDRIAIGRVAMRQRERLAALRVHEDVIVVQTMLWPDEVREPSFEVLSTDVELRPQEKQMAEALVDSLTSDFDPETFTDRYADAVAELVESKASGATRPQVAETAAADEGEVTDLVDALRASVERAKADRSGASAKPAAQTGAETEAQDKKQKDEKAGGRKTSRKKSA